MKTNEEYLADNERLARSLLGQRLVALYRTVFEATDDPASRVDIGELITSSDRGELLLTVDEGLRNLIIYEIRPDHHKYGRTGLPRARISSDAAAVEHLIEQPIVQVTGVARRRQHTYRAAESVFCGVALKTAIGVAYLGAYLTELDDAGVCVLTQGELDSTVFEFALQ